MELPERIFERIFEPVIDQHDTWMVVNPVQGCPKGCAYCYLQDLGQTRARPQEIATPAETLHLLLSHPYYDARLTLALYTCTDALATPRTRAHLNGLLDVLSASNVRNPVCIITKCAITPDVLDAITRSRAAGVPVIVYLSYSGLDADIEHGIDHEALRANFPLLHAAGVPLIHYWRPALPQNSTPAAINRVMDWVTQYASCSVAVGLKAKPGAHEQMATLWPQLRDPAIDLHTADSLWPRATWDFLNDVPERYAGHPLFHTNSCALAYVLHRPDRASVHGTPTCRITNICPTAQRDLCQTALPHRQHLTLTTIERHLARIGHERVPYTWRPHTRTLSLHTAMELRERHNLAQVMDITVDADHAPAERYWPGRLAGGHPLVIDSAQP